LQVTKGRVFWVSELGWALADKCNIISDIFFSKKVLTNILQNSLENQLGGRK